MKRTKETEKGMMMVMMKARHKDSLERKSSKKNAYTVSLYMHVDTHLKEDLKKKLVFI